MRKTIIALGAHADDIDLQAGAALAKYARDGYRIIYGVITTSASGVPGASPDKAYPVRHDEARAAATLYGAEVKFFDFQQCNYPAGPTDTLPNRPPINHASRQEAAITEIAELLTAEEPEIVMTHSTDDLHEDHYYTSILVYRAWDQACASIDHGHRLWLWRNSHLGSVAGFHPNVATEVTANDVALQDRAIRAHISQYQRSPWMHSFAEREARKGGKQFRCEFAQPFISL